MRMSASKNSASASPRSCSWRSLKMFGAFLVKSGVSRVQGELGAVCAVSIDGMRQTTSATTRLFARLFTTGSRLRFFEFTGKNSTELNCPM